MISEPTIDGPSIRDTPVADRHEYILINEILACIALIFRQINDTVWVPALTPKLESWKFTGEDQVVKVSPSRPLYAHVLLLENADTDRFV